MIEMTAEEQFLLDEDQQSRARALELVSFIVEAPAGAGKTELLTQRYLRLLAAVAEPEEIVAITFTNRAAAEMRNRILASLERAAESKIPPEPHKRMTFELAQAALRVGEERGWQLREQPARLRILTIDSLCASLARQMPFLSRFGAQPRIADNSERHYDEASRRTIALLDLDETYGAVLTEALRYFDNDVGRLTRLLASMLARRDQWLRHALGPRLREEAEEALATLIDRDLQCAASFLDGPTQAALMPLACYAANNLPGDSPLAALLGWRTPLSGISDELPQWRALRHLLLTGSGTLRKKLTKGEGFPPKVSESQKNALSEILDGLAGRPGATAVLARLDELPDPHYSDEEWQSVEIMAQLLKLAAGQLWTIFNEQGEADFVEVAQRALLALGDADSPSELALKLDYRIQHLLVDEFQDTSPTQVQLLQRLTAGWQDGDGHTLFCVGDPMQSIYRFRKADVGLFLSIADTGIGNISLERLRLYRNNRSCAAVVDWVNRNFASVFPTSDSVTAGAIQYRQFVAAREPLDGAGVFVNAIVIDEETASDAAEILEAERLLEIIIRERQIDPQRKIAVLVRARNHLDALVARIRSRQPGLRFQAVEIEGLAARQTVQDLLALTHALHHRADRVNWLAILRAPWCSLLLADLHALAAHDHASTVWQLTNNDDVVARLTPDGQRRLAHFREVLTEAFNHQGRARLRRWVEGVWLKLGGTACLHGESDIADAQAYLDLLERLDAAGRFNLDRLDQEVADLYAAPDALADGSLQFMTIHKSKGLEFDSVILPGLHRKGRPDDHALMLWEEVALEGLSEQFVAAPISRRGSHGGNSNVPTHYDYLRLLERERSSNENTRVLYVAATRAIRSLHLVGVARRNSDGQPVSLTGSFLDLLWESIADDFVAAAECGKLPEEGATEPSAPFVSKLVRVTEPVICAVLQRPCAPAAGPAPESAVPDEEEGAADPFAASVGILLHTYLEMLAGSDLSAWSDARIATLQPAMRLWLIRRGHAPTAAKEGAMRVAAALQATLVSPVGRWLLLPREKGAAELALSNVVREHGRDRISSHVVDRCFIEDGQRWIVDYKTARLDYPESVESVWRVHAEHYRDQLERYASLFTDEGLPLRLGIYYAMHGRLVELPT